MKEIKWNLVKKEKKTSTRKNVEKAISALENYFSAVESMNQDEFDYCYTLLLLQGLKHYQIEKYLRSLKGLEL